MAFVLPVAVDRYDPTVATLNRPGPCSQARPGLGAAVGSWKFRRLSPSPPKWEVQLLGVASCEVVAPSILVDGEVTLSFDRLFAGDLSGRARAFQSLVGGRMAVDKAAGLSGMLESEG